ncbi:MAG: ABC transporter ATP-binding protein, partial [Pseudomonadota bacterium]|nr:ABC transporter ATP-binding protein [Pseudomonadota bacterium]
MTVHPGEVMVILGPNGAGKSVLLEAIAGFHRLGKGRIYLGGQDLTYEAAENRHIGFVFQSYALFPHLSVSENIHFALPCSLRGSSNGLRKVGELLERFSLLHLSKRRPKDLSGGEKQRVALARALATDPALFLFDEPFAAMDAPIRMNLGEEIRAMLKETGVPAIFVTHDQVEAQYLADKLAILHEGRLIQTGCVSEVFSRPANVFTASFVGMENIYEGVITEVLSGGALVKTGKHCLEVYTAISLALGEKVNIAIRPEDIVVDCTRSKSGQKNIIQAKIISIMPFGPMFKIRFEAGWPVCAYVT